jgi:hypothetical protein
VHDDTGGERSWGAAPPSASPTCRAPASSPSEGWGRGRCPRPPPCYALAFSAPNLEVGSKAPDRMGAVAREEEATQLGRGRGSGWWRGGSSGQGFLTPLYASRFQALGWISNASKSLQTLVSDIF